VKYCKHFTALRAAKTLTPNLRVGKIVLKVDTVCLAHLLLPHDAPSLLLETLYPSLWLHLAGYKLMKDKPTS